jgi:hypothetical protein
MSSRHQVIGLIVILGFVVGLLGACRSAEPPQIDDISVDPSPPIVVGEQATLIIRASGTDLQFNWTASKGSISSTTEPAVIYTAPDSPGLDTVTVKVTSKGGDEVRSITIEVVTPPPTSTLTPTHTPTSTPTPTHTPTPTYTPTPTPCWRTLKALGG